MTTQQEQELVYIGGVGYSIRDVIRALSRWIDETAIVEELPLSESQPRSPSAIQEESSSSS